MKTIKTNRILCSIVTFILVTLLNFDGFSQEWELGGFKLPANVPNPPLQVSSDINMFSMEYLAQVGGVAFVETAKPSDDLKNSNLLLGYNEKAKDGYRLTITLNGKTYTPYLPDWQLIPIAKFSESQYDACVSIFGKHEESCYRKEDDNNGTVKCFADHYHIQYHPAFNNSLLGLRLFQSDIILMNPNFSVGLPKFNKKTVLGEGEIFNPQTNSINDYFSLQWEISQLGSFESYVLTDKDQEIIYEIVNNKFVISGNPYYFFWKGQNEVIPLNKLTTTMKSKWDTFHNINRPVYDVVVNTMRFAALFRFSKINNPLNYLIFLNEINSLIVKDDHDRIYYSSIVPDINTPTLLPVEEHLCETRFGNSAMRIGRFMSDEQQRRYEELIRQMSNGNGTNFFNSEQDSLLNLIRSLRAWDKQ